MNSLFLKQQIIKIILSIIVISVFAIVYIFYGDTYFLITQLKHWSEISVTITLAYVLTLLISENNKWIDTIKSSIYLLTIAQLYFLINTYFRLPEIENIFFQSPVGRILKLFLKGAISGLFLWHLQKTIQGILLFIYQKLLVKVKKTKPTKDDQIVIYFYNVASFITPIIIFIAWIIYGLKLSWYIAGASTIVLAAVGFAFRGIFHDYLSGILINIESILHVSDFITVNGKKGRVHEIHPRYITLKTLSGSTEYVPNSMMTSTSFTNHTKEKYLGIFEMITTPLMESRNINLFQNSLYNFIKNFNPIADEEIGQTEPRIVVKIESVQKDHLIFRYEFMIELPNFKPKTKSVSEYYFEVDQKKQDLKEAINIKVIDLLFELTIINKPLN